LLLAPVIFAISVQKPLVDPSFPARPAPGKPPRTGGGITVRGLANIRVNVLAAPVARARISSVLGPGFSSGSARSANREAKSRGRAGRALQPRREPATSHCPGGPRIGFAHSANVSAIPAPTSIRGIRAAADEDRDAFFSFPTANNASPARSVHEAPYNIWAVIGECIFAARIRREPRPELAVRA